jgi:hypothetical protein
MPHRHKPAAIGLLLAVTVLTAACSSSHPTERVASVQGGQQAGASRTQTPSVADSDQAMLDYTTCMRAHGVQMRDPFHRPGHNGLSIELPTMTPPVREANQACQHILQPIIDAKQAGQRERAAANLPALISYARCMRQHAVPMPDPGPDGQLNLGEVPGISSDIGRHDPRFRAADADCRGLLPADVAARDDGTGP